MTYVMRLILLFSMLYVGVIPFEAQEEVYGPYPDSILAANWKPDGTQFLTLGYGPDIHIWRDHDGLLLFTLDHRQWLVPDDTGSYISEALWNEDETAIITELHVINEDTRIWEQAWSAETGELIYSYMKAVSYGSPSSISLSQKLNPNTVATWLNDTLSIIDIDIDSASAGESVLDVSFDNQWIDKVQWNDDLSLALVRTYPPRTDTCNRCITWYYLLDMDLESPSLGEVRWQTLASENTSDYWNGKANSLVIDSRGEENDNLQADHTIQLWNLDQHADEFGSKIFEFSQTMGRMNAILLYEDHKQLITVDLNNIGYVEDAHPMAGPQCIDENCVFNIQVWDMDTESPTFGTVVNQIEHTFVENISPIVHFNQSGTQLHVETSDHIDSVTGGERMDTLTAYDLDTWDVVDPTDVITPENSVSAEPLQVDLSNIDNARDFYPIAVNPDHTKVLVGSYTRDLIFVFDLQTGEWLLPKMLG